MTIIGKPVFAGKTEDGKEVIVYKGVEPREFPRDITPWVNVFFIQIDGEEAQALPSDAKITVRLMEMDDTMRLEIESSVWTGNAVGGREDFYRAQALW